MSFDRKLRDRIAATWAGRLLGIELTPVSHTERIISAAGGFGAILLLYWLERDVLGETGAAMMIGSMGASAVLLFAVPHGALSQPWAVLVGHAVSALIGVAVAKLVPSALLASALAVGLSIGAMHYLRAIHPPGGATALTAVIGGTAIHDLGFGFVVTPVLLNAVVMVAAAVAINAAFAWRRYPAALGRRKTAIASPPDTAAQAIAELSHQDFVAALSRIGTFVDISEEEFNELRSLMREEEARRRLPPNQIRLGGYYANRGEADGYSVRRVVDVEPGKEQGRIIWRCVAGNDRNTQGMSSRQEFIEWACCEVERSGNAWMRKPEG
ncbi:MAG: HPP family protein [Alphaproteobacteria bacterium]|nr:HPP family protein [Alphaproteobacteria bacterium]